MPDSSRAPASNERQLQPLYELEQYRTCSLRTEHIAPHWQAKWAPPGVWFSIRIFTDENGEKGNTAGMGRA